MSVTVCYVFPPSVSIFGLFPFLKCDYQFILIQRCLSHYLFIYSLVCVSLSLSCPALFVYIKRLIILTLSSSQCSSFLPAVFTVTVMIN